MKRIFKLLLCCTTGASMLCSCENKENGDGDYWIHDIMPMDIRISVVDIEGNNLLDPLSSGYLVPENIEVEYKGETYKVHQNPDYITKILPATFYGLMLVEDDKYGEILSFGEFEGGKDYTDETITIRWGDGYADVIKFNVDVEYSSKSADISMIREFFLNGEKVDDEEGVITVVKTKETPITWDVSPLEFFFRPVDASGKNLLNPNLEEKIDYAGIKVIYDDKLYECEVDSVYKPLEYVPSWNGLLYRYMERKGGHVLSFGEFEGKDDHTGKEIKILWGDGTSNVISVNHVFEFTGGTPSVRQEWFLDGKSVSNEFNAVIEIPVSLCTF